MQDIQSIETNIPLSYDDADVPLTRKRINFSRFYDMFSIVADLESLRLATLDGLKCTRETNNLLVNHIRSYVENVNEEFCGLGTSFKNALVPTENKYLNSAEGHRYFKRCTSFINE